MLQTPTYFKKGNWSILSYVTIYSVLLHLDRIFFNEVADVLCIELNFVLIEETLKVEFDWINRACRHYRWKSCLEIESEILIDRQWIKHKELRKSCKFTINYVWHYDCGSTLRTVGKI